MRREERESKVGRAGVLVILCIPLLVIIVLVAYLFIIAPPPQVPVGVTGKPDISAETVVLDFRPGNSYINVSFYQRFHEALMKSLGYNPVTIIIMINSSGGVGYQTDDGMIWAPQLVGQDLELLSRSGNITTYWFALNTCTSGCYISSLYAQNVATAGNIGSYTFNHNMTDLSDSTRTWAEGIIDTHHPRIVPASTVISLLDGKDVVTIRV